MSDRPRGATLASPDRIRPVLLRARGGSERQMWSGLGEAWAALSTLISGVLVWGGIGWLIDRFAGTRPIFFVIGAVVGHFGGIYLVYLKSVRVADSPKGVKRDAA